jgi:hypothetical protein
MRWRSKNKRRQGLILEIVPEKAEIVRQIFDWYTRDGIAPFSIAKKLTEMGVPTASGAKKRNEASVRKILSNQHYIGLIVFNRMKMMTFIENGEKVKHKVKQKPEDVIIAKGKHKAIIDEETFEAANSLMTAKPRTKAELELKNPLSGIIRCGKCGSALVRATVTKQAERYACKAHKPRCFKSAFVTEVEDAVLTALETSELPALRLKVNNDEGNAIKIQQRIIENLQEQLVEMEEQEETLFEYFEKKIYTPDVFARRHAALTSKMTTCREELEKAKRAMPKPIDYKERAKTLEKAIEVFKDPTASATEKNNILKTVIERIEYHGTPLNEGKRSENSFDLKIILRR